MRRHTEGSLAGSLLLHLLELGLLLLLLGLESEILLQKLRGHKMRYMLLI